MMTFKTCQTLGEIRPAFMFHADSKSPDGLAASCRECKNTKRKFYRQVGLAANMTREQDAQLSQALQANLAESAEFGLVIHV